MQAWTSRPSSIAPVSVKYGGVNVSSAFPAFLHARLFHHHPPSNIANNLTSHSFPPPSIYPANCHSYKHLIMDDRNSLSASYHPQRRMSTPFRDWPFEYHHSHPPAGQPTAHSDLSPHIYHQELRSKSDGMMPALLQVAMTPNTPTFFPFRPISPLIQGIACDASAQTLDASSQVPTPAVLYTHVNPAEFEQTEYSDWVRATTEYTGTSPISADSPDSVPQTPVALAHAYHNVEELQAAQAHLRELHDLEDPDLHNPYVLQLPDMEKSLQYGSHVISPAPVYPNHSSEEQGTAETEVEESSVKDEEMGLSAHESSEELEPPSPAGHRSIRDDQLLEMRRDGLSYKEIKRIGRFREAESTLRGRVRTLTKEKHERVRKPEWKTRDVSHRVPRLICDVALTNNAVYTSSSCGRALLSAWRQQANQSR